MGAKDRRSCRSPQSSPTLVQAIAQATACWSFAKSRSSWGMVPVAQAAIAPANQGFSPVVTTSQR
ncbi:MAG: hypothetical protein HC918_06815 [Oscillatoriales cyanobacterium SM2_1_8]|nr:hypothetical protein [Oscillatoriales cyanobacterium SM2_1_8]